MRSRVWARCLFALAGVVSPTAATLGQVAPPPPISPDNPKFFVWSEGIPCTYVPRQDQHMVGMARLFLGPTTSGTDAADRVATYIFEHTRTGAWTDINNTPGAPYCGSVASVPCS